MSCYPLICFWGEIHSSEATPPFQVLTLVTATTDVKTTSPLWLDQLFCLFTTSFWFPDYHVFKLDSITTWGTSVFKLIIPSIHSLQDFLLLWEYLWSDSVHFCAYCSHRHAPGIVTSCSIAHLHSLGLQITHKCTSFFSAFLLLINISLVIPLNDPDVWSCPHWNFILILL